jgi:hypothetical protein
MNAGCDIGGGSVQAVFWTNEDKATNLKGCSFRRRGTSAKIIKSGSLPSEACHHALPWA